MEFLSGITWKERILSFPYLKNNWPIILQLSQTIPPPAVSGASTCVLVFCEVLEDCESWTAAEVIKGQRTWAGLPRSCIHVDGYMTCGISADGKLGHWGSSPDSPQALLLCKTCVLACIMVPRCIIVIQTSFCLCLWPKNATQYSRWSSWKQEWEAWSCGCSIPLILPEDSGKGSVSFLRQVQ